MSKIVWSPQPRQSAFMCRPEYECLYGGAAGGGKSDAMLCEAMRQIKVPNYKGIIFRKTYPQLQELILRSNELYKAVVPQAKYNVTDKKWTFPSGAKIFFGTMQHVKDRLNYQGLAYDFIGFDELTHFTWEEYSYMFSRNRPSGPGTRVYMRATANPGGVGHAWVKDRFITAAPPETPITEERTILDPDGKKIQVKRKRIFIPSSVFDNKKLLENDPYYLDNLAMLPEAERKALLYGSWDSFSGQVFKEWRNDPEHYKDRKWTHVIEPFRIPSYWRIWRGYDYGFAKPFSVGWYAADENGNIIIKGCVRNGIDEKSANKIFDEMAEFAKYAFNKSHAACYAVVAYRTAYLKAYYPVEFMAAMLNSFLGNLDKIPAYTEECKRLNIQILKPDINKSYTKFTVDGDKIRFGLGSIKNVGTSAVDEIVAERDRNGQFKDFTDFCERIQETNVNKKCIESLIKAGAFDEFNETRRTLMESFESILDTITSSNKKELEGQVNMFDLGGSDSKEMKYTFKEFPEYSRKELLFMEKEMLGLYISGHPLDNIRHQIEMQTNINSFQMRQMENTDEIGEEIRQEIKDGQMVKYAGIITKIKKKYTKNNKLMAFLTVEDLYGPTEIILFESAYQNCANVLMEDNIVLVNGRLSVREDEETKIVANQITEFATKKKSIFILDVTSLDEKTKVKLKGAIKFFTGDRNNMPLEIINNTVKSMAGGIYITPEILKEFQELIGTENAKVEEVE